MSNLPDQTAEYQAPSVFAKGPDFTHWLRSMNVTREDPSSEVEANYDQLSEFWLPRSLLQKQLDNLKPWARISQALNDWATLHPASLSDQDEHFMDVLSSALCTSYGRILQSTVICVKETVQRRGVDELVDLAFSLLERGQCQVQMDTAFRLCAFPPDARGKLTVLPKPSPIADTLVTSTPLSMGRIVDLERNPNCLSHMHWGSGDELSLIVFIGEFKSEATRNNKNQLIMALLTAQHQRRALGLERSIIIGATCTNAKFEVYSSWWRSTDGFAFCTHPALDLTNPVDFLRCYSLLCKLNSRVKPLVDELEGRQASAIIGSVKLHPWRAPEAPSSTMPSSNGRSGQRESKESDAPVYIDMDDEEPRDLEPQEEAEWEASYEDWQKQSREAWGLTSPKASVTVPTAQRLKDLNGFDLNGKTKEWASSLNNSRFDPVDDVPIPNSEPQPAQQGEAT